MEQIRPAELDFARFAIVVTDVPRVRAGGALPNSQVFTSEVQQYRHAQQRNAGLSPTEPHLLYRQTVSKDIEDDQRWPAYGAADPPSLGWATDPAVGAVLLSRVRSRLRWSTTRGEAPPPVSDELPAEVLGTAVCAVAVTLYRSGARGFGIAWATDDPAAGVGSTTSSSLVELVDRATDAARRSADALTGELAVMVHLLHQPERLGRCGPHHAAVKVRKGLDAISCQGRSNRTVLLPTALVYNSWSEREFVDEATRRAGGPESAEFTTYRCASWISPAAGRALPIRSGFPVPESNSLATAAGEDTSTAPAAGEDEIRSLVGYTLRNASPEGVPLYHLEPVAGRRSAVGTGPRQLHALLGVRRAAALLGESGWAATATRGLQTYLSTPPGSVREVDSPTVRAVRWPMRWHSPPSAHPTARTPAEKRWRVSAPGCWPWSGPPAW